MSLTLNTLRLACVTLTTLWIMALSTVVSAESRHALVIGNSSYGSGFGLVNPVNDANAIAKKLTAIGYHVHSGGALHDLQIDDFNHQIDSFLESVEDGSSTLIYYAGHGAASAGENFLIPILPVGVRLQSESDIRNRAISLGSVLERISVTNPTGVNVLFIDACRDAPVDMTFRSINLTGLTTLDTRLQPQGSFIGFSTEYGKVAEDDNGSGFSPFADAMLQNLEHQANAPIELFYKGVSNAVYTSTSGKQFPIQEPKIRGEFCLVECQQNQSPQRPIQEFGTLSVVTRPVGAEVCYQADGWTDWNCGQQMVLPLGKPVNIKVTAKKHKPYTRTTVVSRAQQQLVVELEPKLRRGYKVAGAIAAVVLTGLLLSSKDSGSDDDRYSITLTLPGAE